MIHLILKSPSSAKGGLAMPFGTMDSHLQCRNGNDMDMVRVGLQLFCIFMQPQVYIHPLFSRFESPSIIHRPKREQVLATTRHDICNTRLGAYRNKISLVTRKA